MSLAGLVATSMMLGGCATTDSVKRAQASADQAMQHAQAAEAAAQRAQSTADAAGAAAQRAQSTADAAGTAAQGASQQAQANAAQISEMQTKWREHKARHYSKHRRHHKCACKRKAS